MSKKPDGGPAFPHDGHGGMPVRYYLAGQALTDTAAYFYRGDQTAKQVAAKSVELADAVLAELEKDGR